MAIEIVPQEPDTIGARLRRFDLRALWRLSAWGGAAALALAAVAFASQTQNGSQRLAALASTDMPVRPVATVTIPPHREQEWEIARLEAQLRTLTADRDHLAERVAGLEHNIEDLTGSIKRQTAQTPQSQTPPSAPSATAAPVISPPATTEAKQPGIPAHEAVPLPPVRVAALPTEPAAPPPIPEFGVALASSLSLEVLHMQWSALKANFGPLLAGLQPIAAREQRGTVTYYRLVLGPLPNAPAASKLCARLAAAHAPCHTGKFSGDPL